MDVALTGDKAKGTIMVHKVDCSAVRAAAARGEPVATLFDVGNPAALYDLPQCPCMWKERKAK